MATYLEVEENEEPESSQERDVVDPAESDIIEPANIGVERCFNHLNSITDDELIAANRSVRDNQKPARKSVLRQRDFIKLNTERKLIKVNLSSMRQVIVFPQKDSKVARQIDSGVPIVFNDQCLIPIGIKRTNFNDKAKEVGLRAFGGE